MMLQHKSVDRMEGFKTSEGELHAKCQLLLFERALKMLKNDIYIYNNIT